MSKTTFEKLETVHPKNVFPAINITPVLWHMGDFCGIERIEVRWPDELRMFVDKSLMEQMKAENDKLRDLVTYMYRCYVIGHDWGLYGASEKEHVEATMRELGIEV